MIARLYGGQVFPSFDHLAEKKCHSMRTSPDQASAAFDVSSVPLSLMIIFGLPRSVIRSVNSRTTRQPNNHMSTTARRNSGVTSSTMLSTRNCRPVTS